MKKATSYVISKTLTQPQLEKAIDRVIAPLYGYKGGKPTKSLVEIAYGMHQMKNNLVPKSLSYFDNLKKTGYSQRIPSNDFRSTSR